MAPITFIGGGVMAEAMISAIISQEVAAPGEISVGEVIPARREYLTQTYGVFATDDNREAIGRNSIVSAPIIVALKPQHISALESVRNIDAHTSPLFVSIAAGIGLGLLEELTGSKRLIRVMPNTPAQIGAGMSVWTATPDVSPDDRERVAKILGAMGRELYVGDERYIDMATALSGSGPGYVFLFLEALIDAGVHIGLPRDQAEILAGQTLLGSATLADTSSRHAAELRNMVTSPGGTTAEGIAALESGGFRAAVTQAVIAAYEKSRQLS